MKFEIIKNSQSNTGYAIADNEYMGQTRNLNGWSFELAKANGEVCYSSVYYTTETPEDYIAGRESEYLRWCMSIKDLTFTGRVVFRGYFDEYMDLDCEGKWENFVREVPFDIGDLLYVDDVEEDVYDDTYDYLYDVV